MKKSNLIKNLISFGVAIAVIAVIAIYTKPKLPAPENLTATVLISSAQEYNISAQFTPVSKGVSFEPAYRMTFTPQASNKKLDMIFDLSTGKILKLQFGGRNVASSVLRDFKVDIVNEKILVQGKLPPILGKIFNNSRVTVNAVDLTKRYKNISAAATAQVLIEAPAEAAARKAAEEAAGVTGEERAAPSTGGTGIRTE
ncbi:hypothetical protein A2824_03795 [Candidatus Nomurabacteria bacterium RIFCSPHIGHO2_01_FULL_42_16]|uniref:Uncharacterized protein n=1 Tax=Candidatus Nomurabacteria bacterium RIFCSPHIGHO2_01_FULL_42_16 TaxID=1801743 RepID=A0A1F6VLJ7_9BACT|nr:MAG: hypothetical protein A2824_03795 [Candidatus Nomurabacteria bacterium RIFCSPHIGHO2_01_FULL_42_16]